MVRPYLSISSLVSAAHFCREAKLDELAFGNSDAETLVHRHRANVLAAVVLSVSAVEGAINEFFSDCADLRSSSPAGLDAAARERLAAIWVDGDSKLAWSSVLAKYQAALAILQVAKFPTGSGVYPEAKALVTLRNHVVHYEPTWHEEDEPRRPQADRHEMERLLRHRFPHNPMAGVGSPFFPEKALGHGCAAWACRTARQLIEDFYAKLEAPAPHIPYAERLEVSDSPGA